MVAILVALMAGSVAFVVKRAAPRYLGWLKAPQFSFEGNIPTPLLPAGLPVARAIALPPLKCRVVEPREPELDVVTTLHVVGRWKPSTPGYESHLHRLEAAVQRNRDEVAWTQHRIEHMRHRINGVEDLQSDCQVCHDRAN